MKNIKIVFATGNKHKIEEFGAILKKYIPDIELVSMKEVGIFDDIVEDGSSFEENAMIKARAVSKYGYIGVADDSGLTVEALGGAPGIYSARYAGEHGNDKKNNQKLLADMQEIENRDAAFVCTIACAFPKHMSNDDFCVRGECRGIILHEERGEGGFGYDPLFFVEKSNKTYAELSADEKNQISHRAVATELFANKFCMELMSKGEINE